MYMHRLTLVSSLDALNTPEAFGFLQNQARPFTIPLPAALDPSGKPVPPALGSSPETTATTTTTTASAETLHAWHVLPQRSYFLHRQTLVQEPSGLAPNTTFIPRSLHILRHEPCATVVIHLHGASGTIASGLRPHAYRALAATDSARVHVLALDYRGFGLSSGTPSEGGLVADAVALVQWTIREANVPSEQIIIHAQSLGTAVAVAVVEYFAAQEPAVELGGLVLSGGMYDVASLMSEYRFNGVLRLLAPLDLAPFVVKWMGSKLRSKWTSGDRLQRAVAKLKKCHIEILHAQNDWVVSPVHADKLFQAAILGTKQSSNLSGEADDIESIDLGAAGKAWAWTDGSRVIRKQILTVGEHDTIMALPVTTDAIMRAMHQTDVSQWCTTKLASL